MNKRDRALLRQHWRELSTRTTELGSEKLCPRCGEWWPHTDEFFSFIRTRGHFHNECKACRAEVQATRRQAKAIDQNFRQNVALSIFA